MATAIKKEFAFTWEGKDRKGNRVSGRSLAVNENALRADLRRQGISPLKVRKQGGSGRKGKPTPEDIAVFSRQLATMLQSGIPLVQGLEIIGAGHDKPAVQRLVLDIKSSVEAGSTLHEALSKHPLYFDDLFVNLVEAGEQAGALETLLDKVATYKEKILAIKSKIKSALFYPLSIIVVAIVITAIIMIFVIPAFKDVFKSSFYAWFSIAYLRIDGYSV